MLDNIISVISHLGATARVCVGISVSPNIGLEMIEINVATASVTKYAQRPLEFDYTKREIVDFDLFKEAVVELFEELGISQKSNVILNLPSIYFGLTTLPANLPPEATTNAVISEAEQSYIFKRAEPAVSWINLAENTDSAKSIAFSAIQQSMLIEITEIFKSLGCSLIAIETSILSILKALDYSGFAKAQMQPEHVWNLIIVNSVSYIIVSLMDKTILDYYEEPLALKSFVDDEIYTAVATSAKANLESFPAQDCIIISETDLVSAEILSMKLPEQLNTSFVECNKYSEKSVLKADLTVLPNLSPRITLQAIGAGIYATSNYPIKFNLLGQDLSGSFLTDDIPKIQFGNTEIELTSKFIRILSMIVGAVIIIPMLLIMLVLQKLTGSNQATYNDLKTELNKCQSELKKYEQVPAEAAFNENSEINAGIALNRQKLFEYSLLGINLPKKLWLTYLKLETGIKVEGASKDIESIYEFYKNLRISTENQELKLHKLNLASDNPEITEETITPDEATFYKFEITDLKDKPPEEAESGDDKTPKEEDKKSKKSEDKKKSTDRGGN